MGRIVRLACSMVALLGAVVVTTGTVALVAPAAPASADGPAPCTSGPPPYPYAGFCATYLGDNTFYGSYGPGFPTAQSWGFCADPPASGGGYPAPSYNYVAGGAPAGANLSENNALGFAFGQAEALGDWGGQPGQFTADQAAVAGKLLYDVLDWGIGPPSMDPGVLAAYDAIDYWYNQAVGTTGAPVMSTGLAGGGNTFGSSATEDVHVQFPGTGSPVVGLPVTLSITNGTFNSPGGPTTVTVSTDAGGNIALGIFANGTGTITVTVNTTTVVGQVGLGFYHPTTGVLGAQYITGFPAPTTLSAADVYTATVPFALTGSVSIQKAGDDTAYYGLAGATFTVFQGSNPPVATLVTDATGASPPSPQLPAGNYQIHEVTAPPGYTTAPDQIITVDAGANTVASYTGAYEDHIVPATVTIAKVDAQGGAPLGGAVLDTRYSTANNGVYDQDLGTCTTTSAGTCTPPGNDGASLLPGNYQITELSAPPGYYLDPATVTQTLSLGPGQAGSVSFSDFLLGSLSLLKSGNDTAYYPVAGAVFGVTGPAPSTASVGTLTVDPTGASNTVAGLQPGSYTVTETTPPPGYQPVAPVSVTVAVGHATTTIDVTDPIQPATVTLFKVDAQTQAPLAGAVLDVKYSSADDGTFDQDLGTCTTAATGECSPAGNDGASLLPGDYQITEVSPPPGYVVDPTTTTQTVTLTPGQAGTVTFDDHLLVPATFQKVATGNVDPAQVIYAGAVIDVTQGIATGPQVATCTTDAAGGCTTAAVLVSGSPYCWIETVAPPGLAAGANGCFTATNGQGAQPITVTDPGEFVAIQAKKVAAADPTVTLPGAVFDLYRVDNGMGPDAPTPPADATAEPGQTWVARSITTGTDGLADFPMEFPGYAYCVVEYQAPANYVADPDEVCTGVLAGTTTVPALVTTVTVADTEAAIILQAHKFNALDPNTTIAGATYDLYVEGPIPVSGIPAPQPSGVTPEAGDTWYGRATTDSAGQLAFTVPAGYAWCLLEVSAPPDYAMDPALHCTGVLNAGAPLSATTIALPETLALVHLQANKFNATQPNTVIPGATYELLVSGTVPPGYSAPAAPAGTPVPAGDTYWTQGTTDAQGLLTFTIPAGSSWCLHEITAPSQYQVDSAFHCTGVITTDSLATAATVALPEQPVPTPGTMLAFTGGPSMWLAWGGVLLVVSGAGLVLSTYRRRHRGRRSGMGTDP